MITTRILTDLDEINSLLPACQALALRSGCFLPFQQLTLPWLWWKHFNTTAEIDFGHKRGRNFLGARTWVEKFYLVIAESGGRLQGFVPMVVSRVKLRSQQPALRLLSFSADSVLAFYQDFTVMSALREPALTQMLDELIAIAEVEHALLFLGHIPENSPNFEIVASTITQRLSRGYEGGVARIQNRGGVYPWTIPNIAKCLDEICKHNSVAPDLRIQTESLQMNLHRQNSALLMFPGTRHKLEATVVEIASQLTGTEQAEALREAMASHEISYPYIILPERVEMFEQSLSASNRYYFKRYLKKFGEAGGVFENIAPAEVNDQDIKEYLALHLERWGDDSVAVNEATMGFHVELSRQLAAAGHFRLFFAKLEGKRVAAHACLDIGNRREYYFSGRRRDTTKLPIGKLLCYQTIVDAVQQGRRYYDFGYGGDEYKSVFTRTSRTLRGFFLAAKGDFPDLNALFPKYEYMALETPVEL